MLITKAVHKNARISPFKCRLVANQVRNLGAGDALEILRFSRKRAASIFYKLLMSAMANAENNHGADVDALVVSRIIVDSAKTFKRFRARARGRAGGIKKRNSHISLALSDA